MFCTACAAANPRAATSCGGCGAVLGTGGWLARRRGRWRVPERVALVHLVLAVLLPLAGVAVSGGFVLAERGERAAAYARGIALLRSGDPSGADVALADAGGYAEANALRGRVAADIAVIDPLYLAGLDALARDDAAGAIAALIPVVAAYPRYRDAATMLAAARAAEQAAGRATVDAAALAGDWLAAERGLALLAARSPGDDALVAELAALRRDHAPILFAWKGRLLLVGPDGRDQRVVVEDMPVSWPIWSPDRTRIAFVCPDDADGTMTLHVVGADGAGLRQIGASLRPYEAPVWSPDGTRIAYISADGLPEDKPAASPQVDPSFAAFFGSSLYFDTEGDARGQPVDTGQSAATPTPSDNGSAGSADGPEWVWIPPPSGAVEPIEPAAPADPDGSATTTGTAGSSVAAAATGPTLVVVDVATGSSSAPVAGRVMVTNSPTWSPEGDRIAFVSRPANQEDQRLANLPPGEVYIVDLTDGTLAAPAPGQVPNPWSVAWSPAPGAETLLVWSRDAGDGYQFGPSPLTLIDTRAGVLGELNPNRALVSMPVWSPDGGRVAYIEDSQTLRVREVPGVPGIPVPLAEQDSAASAEDRSVRLPGPVSEFLSWSPDGSAVLVAGGGRPSQLVPLTGPGAGVPEEYPLAYDTNRRVGAPPQWSPLNPAPDPQPASIGGTARDG